MTVAPRSIRPDIIGVLDVGTCHIVCMIAARDATAPSGLRLIGLGHQISRGVKASVVVDLEAAADATCAAIYQAQRMAGVSLDAVHVAGGAGRSSAKIVACRVATAAGTVSAADLGRLDRAGQTFVSHDDSVVLQLERLQLTLDGVPCGETIIGRKGRELQAVYALVAGDAVAARNLVHVVESQALVAARRMPSPVATAYAVTNADERARGVTVIDCGGGSTTLVMFAHGHVVGLATIPVGGNHLTFDIAKQLQRPLNEAERIKLDYAIVGAAQSGFASQHDASAPDSSLAVISQASRALIHTSLTSRASSLLRSIAERLERIGAQGAVQAQAGRQVLLAGGASVLPGLAGLAGDLLGRPVRLARVQALSDFPESVRHMPFAASLGLMWAEAAAEVPVLAGGAAGMWPIAREYAQPSYLGRSS